MLEQCQFALEHFQGKGKCKDQTSKCKQAGSQDDAGQSHEPEGETGSLVLGAFVASQRRVVRFA